MSIASQRTRTLAIDESELDKLNREFESPEAARSGGVRRWTIVLRSGVEITFDAAWDWTGGTGPAHMIIEHRNYITTGSKPRPQKIYVFPETNGGKRMAAAIAVDIADVQAIVQVFDPTS